MYAEIPSSSRVLYENNGLLLGKANGPLDED